MLRGFVAVTKFRDYGVSPPKRATLPQNQVTKRGIMRLYLSDDSFK